MSVKIRHICGHYQSHHLPEQIQNNRIRYIRFQRNLELRQCSDCLSQLFDNDNEIISINGSHKQIKWAIKIRKDVLKRLDTLRINVILPKWETNPKLSWELIRTIQKIQRIDSAKFWIDQFGKDINISWLMNIKNDIYKY